MLVIRRFLTTQNFAARIMVAALVTLPLIGAERPEAALAAGHATAAIVTDLEGSALLITENDATPLHILAALAPESRIRLTKGTTMTFVYLDTGVEYVVRGEAEDASARITTSGPNVSSSASVTSRKLGIAEALGPVRDWVGNHEIQEAGFRVRGAKAPDTVHQIALISPQGMAVMNLRPEFRWKEVAENCQYRFVLKNADGDVVRTRSIKGTTLQLETEIDAGQTYQWNLEATAPSGQTYTSTRAEFRTLGSRDRDVVERNRPATGATISQQVLYASFLESVMLREPARRMWRELAAERSDDPTLAALAKQ